MLNKMILIRDSNSKAILCKFVDATFYNEIKSFSRRCIHQDFGDEEHQL